MASRDTPGYDHKYEDHPHNHQVHSTVIHEIGEHDDDHMQEQLQQQQHHEKKSVLKKVKAKAKKTIKNTLGIKKHDHDHEHEHEQHGYEHEHHPHREDDEDLDEDEDDEDDDDEGLEDPEVHGAPKAASKFVKDKKVNSDKPRVHFGEMPPLEPDLRAPKDRFGTGTPTPGNYQTMVTDPTGAGGKEIDVESFTRSFGKMEVTPSNDPDSSNQKSFSSIPTQTGIQNPGIRNAGITRSHDQISPDYSSIPTQIYPIPEQSQPIPEAKHLETNVVGEHQPTNQSSKSSSYTEKFSTATYAIADKAISAKNVVASKLGYGAGSNDMAEKNKGMDSGSGTGTVGYGKQVATAVTDTLAPVYEKVAGAGSALAPVYGKVVGAWSAVVSKVSGKGTGTGQGQGSDAGTGHGGVKGPDNLGQGSDADMGHGGVKGPDKGVTMKTYLTEKFRPSEEDKALSEVISGALHKRNEDEDHSKKVKEAMGRVTESEEVVKRLGTDEEIRSGSSGSDSGVIVGGGSGSGIGMVDRMRGTVASWFGSTNKGVGVQTGPTTESQSPSSNVGERQEDMLSRTRHEGMSHVDENVGEERRAQESTN